MTYYENRELTDLSIGGCFVEMLAPPVAIGANVGLVLRVGQRTIRAEGVVTASLPHFGLGIRFLHFEPDQLKQIEELVAAMDRGEPITAVTSVAVVMSMAEAAVPDARGTLAAVFGWFRTNDILGREEFLALIKAKTKP